MRGQERRREAKGSTGVSGYKAPGPAESFLAHWQGKGEGGGDLSLKAKGDPEKLGSHQWGREDVGSPGPHRELSGGLMLRCRELSWEEILSYSVGADCRANLDAGLTGVYVLAPGLWLPACVTLGKSSGLSESHSSVRQREEYLPCGVMGRKLPHDQPGTQQEGGTRPMLGPFPSLQHQPGRLRPGAGSSVPSK